MLRRDVITVTPIVLCNIRRTVVERRDHLKLLWVSVFKANLSETFTYSLYLPLMKSTLCFLISSLLWSWCANSLPRQWLTSTPAHFQRGFQLLWVFVTCCLFLSKFACCKLASLLSDDNSHVLRLIYFQLEYIKLHQTCLHDLNVTTEPIQFLSKIGWHLVLLEWSQ